MGPVDPLRLLLVLFVVSCGVKELLGDDRSADPRLGQRYPRTLGGGGESKAGVTHLEERPHVRHVEWENDITVDDTGTCCAGRVFEGCQLHGFTPQNRAAVRAYDLAMFTSEPIGTLSPSGPGRALDIGP